MDYKEPKTRTEKKKGGKLILVDCRNEFAGRDWIMAMDAQLVREFLSLLELHSDYVVD